MLYLQSHFLRPACPFLNTGEKNTYGGTAGLLFMVRLSDLPVLWRWKTPGRLLIWGKARFRDLQNGFSGPERKFSLRLRNCEFNSQGGNLFSDSRIRVTFDGVRGETPDKFNLSGQAKGINLQIADARGNIARAGKVMPAIPLTGNEEALDYTLRIVRNGKKLEAGNYFAVLGFRVDYE